MMNTPLMAALSIGLFGLGLELLGALVPHRLTKRIAYAGSILTTAFAVSLYSVTYLSVPAVIIGIIALYRLVNAFRLLYGRSDWRRLAVVTRRTTLYLAVCQLLSLGLAWQAGYYAVSARQWLYILLALALIVAVVLNIALRRNLRRSALRPSDKYTPDSVLPTISVCVPARNETESLAACLQAVLASDYPKLEVLVLDDCSQKQTSEIIKGFAKDGVRFIAGEPPRGNWLAKNQAYQVLAEAATGELLLFMGVDVRLEKHAVKAMAASLTARRKQMISVMPKGLQKPGASGLAQPMRYWWELALPRRLFKRPPVLSTVWMIRRETLMRLGGLKAVSNTVVPESYFARELAKADGYSFMRSSGRLAIGSNKEPRDQWQTAIRTRYPQMRKRPEAVMLLSLAELTALVLPLGVFVVGFFVPLGLLFSMAGVTTVLLGVLHWRIIRAWQITGSVYALAAFPLAVLAELYVLQLSMYKYEFSNVEWKDRNICIPVMRVIPRLPRV